MEATATANSKARETLILVIDRVLEEYHAEKERKCLYGGKCDSCKCHSEEAKSI